ncbi:MAG: diguanylate cyclase [Gallionella sp.]|jgi:diguanylate cyclase (GGDEF)-like protein/PAS domain S-box-containing protein
MKEAPLPVDEAARLAALRGYDILDTEPEAVFDRLVELASHLCQTPIAAISLVDEGRQWFKAVLGLDARETPRTVAFCAHAILQDHALVVNDAMEDQRFFDNPLVVLEPKIRFYAGVQLTTTQGVCLGTLCVMDRVPRTLTDVQMSAFRALADIVMANLDLRLSHKNIKRYADDLQLAATIFEFSSESMIVTDADNCIVAINPAFTRTTGYLPGEVIGKSPRILSSGRQNQHFYRNMWRELDSAGCWSGEVWNLRKNGEEYAEWLSINVIFNEDGSKRLHVAIFSDITVKKQAEMALQESNQKINLLLQSMAEGVYGIDINGRCTFVNESFLRILGYDQNEVVGQNIHELIHYLHADGTPYSEAECRINAAHKCNENIHHADEVFWHKFGVPIPVEYWSRPIVIDGCVTGAVTTFIDVSERRMEEERVNHLATHDTLCDLPNRDLLRDRLRQSLLAAQRDKLQIGLMYIDLDKFKPINDDYGHGVGDQVLLEAARRMQACVRATDTVARIGGDEFIVLLSEVDSAADVLLVADKIREAINRPMQLADLELNISSSIGMAMYPEHGNDEITLINHADTAMYAAKQLGRNNVQAFGYAG